MLRLSKEYDFFSHTLGCLVTNYISGDVTAESYADGLKEHASEYNPFNLLLIEQRYLPAFLQIAIFNTNREMFILKTNVYFCRAQKSIFFLENLGGPNQSPMAQTFVYTVYVGASKKLGPFGPPSSKTGVHLKNPGVLGSLGLREF